MLIEQDHQQKSSWELLREQSSSWWNSARQNGERTRFAHPDELAEHVVFSIVDFFKSNLGEEELTGELNSFKTSISRGRYEDVINDGELLYRKKFLPQNPNLPKSLVTSILSSLRI
jgi:hypothetical protein